MTGNWSLTHRWADFEFILDTRKSECGVNVLNMRIASTEWKHMFFNKRFIYLLEWADPMRWSGDCVIRANYTRNQTVHCWGPTRGEVPEYFLGCLYGKFGYRCTCNVDSPVILSNLTSSGPIEACTGRWLDLEVCDDRWADFEVYPFPLIR